MYPLYWTTSKEGIFIPFLQGGLDLRLVAVISYLYPTICRCSGNKNIEKTPEIRYTKLIFACIGYECKTEIKQWVVFIL